MALRHHVQAVEGTATDLEVNAAIATVPVVQRTLIEQFGFANVTVLPVSATDIVLTLNVLDRDHTTVVYTRDLTIVHTAMPAVGDTVYRDLQAEGDLVIAEVGQFIQLDLSAEATGAGKDGNAHAFVAGSWLPSNREAMATVDVVTA